MSSGFSSHTVDLAGVFSDADSDVLTFSVVTSDETVVSAEIEERQMLKIMETGIGMATVTITANDSHRATVSDIVGIKVIDNAIEQESSIYGIWKVISLNISGELRDVRAPVLNPPDYSYNEIVIAFPESLEGGAEGHTFYNSFWVSFKIKGEDQIVFTTYGATRVLEDEWGTVFSDNIRNVSNLSIENDILLFTNDDGLKLIKLIKTL